MYKSTVPLDAKEIQQKVSDYQLFRYYTGENFALNKAFSSPLREDKRPSFCIYANGSGLKFKDFGSGHHGSIFDFVMLKFNCTFDKALNIINNDIKTSFNTTQNSKLDIVSSIAPKIAPIKHLETIIEIKKRKWSNTLDDGYWGSYGLNLKILEKFNIFPVSYVWVNKGLDDKERKLVIYPRKGELHYAYRFGNKLYKIYSPLSKIKWISNAKNYHIQGYEQLPERGKLLLLTKSFKDVLVLYKMGFHSIAPQSESNYISEELIKELKSRFTKIITFYDDDDVGNLGAERLLQYKIPNIKIKKCKEYKDISDFVKVRGEEEGLKKIQELIIFKGLINFLN